MKLGAQVIAWLAALCVAGPSLACSPVPGYRVPTNLELTAQADVIAIARVGAGQDMAAVVRQPELVGDTPPLTFEIVTILKGQAPERQVRMEEAFLTRAREAQSDPRELMLAHPDSYSGPCTRHVFVAGGTVLLFLERGSAGRLEVMSQPFARVSEDVTGEEALWVRAVRDYVQIAALPKSAWPKALRQRRTALAMQPDDPVASALAADAGRQIKAPSEAERRAAFDRQMMQWDAYRKAISIDLPGLEE